MKLTIDGFGQWFLCWTPVHMLVLLLVPGDQGLVESLLLDLLVTFPITIVLDWKVTKYRLAKYRALQEAKPE